METCDELPKKSKRNFVEAWLSDERYKDWIRKVSSDETFYYCIVCNNSFSCNSSHVSRHAGSACHRNNLKKKRSSHDNVTVQNKRPFKLVFKHEWLDIADFKLWLREVPHNENICLCEICNKSLAACLSHIRRHAGSKSHVNLCKERNNEASEPNDLNMRNNESFLLFDERKKSAEIKYAALIAERNIPLQTAQEMLSFFQNIDPNVLKDMSMDENDDVDQIVNQIEQNSKNHMQFL